MKQWKKVDDKTKASIVQKKLLNPDMSDRDIQKSFPQVRSNKTISTIVGNEFRTNKDSYDEILEKNLRIIEKWQEIVLSKIDTLDIRNIKDLSTLNNILYQSVRQNRMIEGYHDEKLDSTKIIPAVINIQVVNN